MAEEADPMLAVVNAWRTNSRITSYLFEHLPTEVWRQKVPGAPRRTVRMIAGHIHNCRCMWVKTLGRKHGIRVPASVNRMRVTRSQLLAALDRSGRAVEAILRVGLENGGKLPGFPLDVFHFENYLAVHEGHHRGQICMLARQFGYRLPDTVSAGLWQWSKRAREAGMAEH